MKTTFAVLTTALIIIAAFSSCSEAVMVEPMEEIAVSEISVSEYSAVMAVPESTSPESSVPDIPPPQGEISILVLGDSIARGYGLKNVEQQRFSSVLAEELSQKFAQVNVVNYGVDGITGEQLVEMLKNDPPKELADSEYVLISIGGNNILGKLTTLEGLSELSSGLDANVFVDYFRFLISDTKEEKAALDYARETLNLLFKSANDAFSGKEFKKLIGSASEKLEKEIPEIIGLIRSANPDAEIIIQTVYNPYKGINIVLKALDHPLNLALYGQQAVEPLNNTIERLAPEYGYTVAPVWGGFESSSKQLTNAGFDILNAVFGLDPHPNAAGHALIAEIYYQILSDKNTTEE